MPSKRERGKQRKAAKKQAVAAKEDAAVSIVSSTLVRKGDNHMTTFLSQQQSPQAYRVSGAGTEFVNGLYELDKKGFDSNNRVNVDALQYHYTVPNNAPSGAGKTLTLFPCTLTTEQKWWFISEADPFEPGTDADIDYYQHKSISLLEAFPASSGWILSPNGVDLPPKLEAVGLQSLTPKSVYEAVLPNVLNFLGRCEDETFRQVVASVEKGNLVCPSLWIKVLWRAATESESFRLQIAQNIGPLVRCMCADTERLFFKSNIQWRKAIWPFAELIFCLVCGGTSMEENSDGLNTIAPLLQHEGLLTTIVQWEFWDETLRPDIIEELQHEHLQQIRVLGSSITQYLVKVVYDGESEDVISLSEGNLNLVQTIGSAPVVSKEYDPSNMVSFVAGKIQTMKATGSTGGFSNMLQLLIRHADCVDEGLIKEVIDLGVNTSDYATALFVGEMSSSMLVRTRNVVKKLPLVGDCQTSDTRVALAIRNGLIEMCLGFIRQYGWRESFSDETFLSLSDYLERLFEIVHSTSFQSKSWKAIRHKKEIIEVELELVMNTLDFRYSAECQELLDMIKSIVNLNGSFCCQCGKSLRKTAVKLCNGCGLMAYCSKECQREDWLNGHELACCKSPTPETMGQFQGRLLTTMTSYSVKAVTKLKDLEVNISMIQLKLFVENAESILSQAKALGVPIHDCVVQFDLRGCPPVFDVLKYTNYFNTPSSQRGFVLSRSTQNIACTYICSIHNREVNGDGVIPNLIMYRLFPHILLSKKITINAQLEYDKAYDLSVKLQKDIGQAKLEARKFVQSIAANPTTSGTVDGVQWNARQAAIKMRCFDVLQDLKDRVCIRVSDLSEQAEVSGLISHRLKKEALKAQSNGDTNRIAAAHALGCMIDAVDRRHNNSKYSYSEGVQMNADDRKRQRDEVAARIVKLEVDFADAEKKRGTAWSVLSQAKSSAGQMTKSTSSSYTTAQQYNQQQSQTTRQPTADEIEFLMGLGYQRHVILSMTTSQIQYYIQSHYQRAQRAQVAASSQSQDN